MNTILKFVVGFAMVWSTTIQAQTPDLSFGSGNLNGWTAGGGQGVQVGDYQDNGIGVTTVNTSQTISCCGANIWQINPYPSNYMVGIQPGNSFNYSQMATGLGLSAASTASLDTLVSDQGGQITSTAWVSKNFSFTAPTSFKMAWVYTSVDYVPFNDGSVATLTNVNSPATVGKINNVLGEYVLLGATNPGTGNYSTDSYGSTGWQLAKFEILSAGTYKVGFAVFNQADTLLSPVLQVSDKIGTVTKNGELFTSVAPNIGSVAPSVNEPPSVVSASTANLVTTSTNTGTSVVSTSLAYGSAVTAVTVANARGTQTANALAVTQTKTTTIQTPFTTTTTTTTPVTTTTTTTPVTTTTYSDGSVIVTNGSATVTSSTTNTVSSTVNNGTETVEATQNSEYSTRIDQLQKLQQINRVANYNLDNNVLDRNPVVGNGFNQVNRNNFYMLGDASTSSRSDTYSFTGTTLGLGYDLQVARNWIIGGQFARSDINLFGTNSGGSLTKESVGLYSAARFGDWILKNDLGYSTNNYKTNHAIPELSLYNQGNTQGRDIWSNNRIYTPSMLGFRPFAGVRIEQNQTNAMNETGSAITAMNFAATTTNTVSEDIGLRYDLRVNKNWRFISEYAHNTQNYNSFWTSIGYMITPGSQLRLRYGVATQAGYNVQSGMVEFKWWL
jgi:hypothetical protein